MDPFFLVTRSLVQHKFLKGISVGFQIIFREGSKRQTRQQTINLRIRTLQKGNFKKAH